MRNNRYFLPPSYVANPAVSFGQTVASYWDQTRIHNSLSYQAAVYSWAKRLVQEHHLHSIADVGCGSAVKLAALHHALPDVEVWGLDQPGAIRLCRSHYDFGSWHAINLDEPECLPERKFDLIISSDVIEHLDDPDLLLDAIRHMAHADTLVLLSTPERIRLRGSRSLKPPNPNHVREWSKDEFAAYLRSRKFRILDHELLPAFRPTHDLRFFTLALKRWARGKSIAYNQAVLAQAEVPRRP